MSTVFLILKDLPPLRSEAENLVVHTAQALQEKFTENAHVRSSVGREEFGKHAGFIEVTGADSETLDQDIGNIVQGHEARLRSIESAFGS
ncbi:MAG: hypothetical protein K9G62_04105 [Alphaproteobacteria bacterium]|nr:hypothetical protein [Alphaproteobacteria bacterium]